MSSHDPQPIRWQRAALSAVLALPVVLTNPCAGSADDSPDGFPTRGLLPKQETGALRFLQQNPDYDGRGVVVAVFDTGVDPGAAGLQTTPDGKPKVIDMIDGTGSGDVDTSTVRKVKNGVLEGLSGRQLRIDPAWKNPSGEFRVGVKCAWDFFPPRLIPSLKKERRERFELAQAATAEAVRRQILAWDTQHPSPSDEQQPERDELRTRLEQLQQAAKNADDPGPLYDCVLFRDGDVWRAVIDTNEDADLGDETVLTNYRNKRQYAGFGEDSFLNFAVNIYDNGNRLSIVTDAGAHGTHVAGIVAAYFPDHPELNGIAPGAQIVSVKIGDSRISGMETGAGLVRGLSAVVRNKCDLINMSYGEPTVTPDRGRLVELFTELVEKHGVIFVASGGNAGPALSTVGAPGGTTSAVIGVGAYVSPQMMKVAYTLPEQNPGMPYSWTSRGPTTDGDPGIDIFAPGGAIAPVPRWTRQRNMRMNGTSMAAPNACGNIALVLSGLKATGTAYSPWSIRRAIQNTAQPIPASVNGRPLDAAVPFAQGPGLLQVDRAFASLIDYAEAIGERTRFRVAVAARNNARGIHLRDRFETRVPFRTRVSVKPVLPKSAARDALTDFELRVQLQPTADWVGVGSELLLNHGGGSFEVRINTSQLDPDAAHFAEIHGLDASDPDRGPLFRVPITVVRPRLVPEKGRTLSFRAGQIHRMFLDVPDGATWANIRIRRVDDAGRSVRYLLHATQLLGGELFEAANHRRLLSLQSGEPHVESIDVTPRRTLEVVLAQYWSSAGESQASVDVTFHGIQPDDESVTLSTSDPIARVALTAPLQLEHAKPKARLTTRRSILAPTDAVVRPLKADRDRLPDGRVAYELVLTYVFEQPELGRVTPRFPFNDEMLYESPYGTQLWLLFDSAGRRVMTDDVWPEAVSTEKGKYTLRIQLRHTDASVLETLRTSPVQLDRPLTSALALSCYRTRPDAVRRKRSLGPFTLTRGERMAVYLAAPPEDDLPKSVRSGDVLLGSITWGARDELQTGSGYRPGGYPLKYHLQRPVKSSVATTGGDVVDSIDGFRLSQLKRVNFEKNRGKFESLAARLLKKDPDNLDVLQLVLHRLDTIDHHRNRLAVVVAAADDLIEKVDQEALATELGRRADPENTEAAKRRKAAKRRREILVDALYRKGRALGYMKLPDVIAKHPIADPEAHDKAFEANFAELRTWVDTTGEKYFLLHVRRERHLHRYGNALKLLNKYIGASPPDYRHFKKRRDIYGELGWTHLWEYEKRRLVIRFPKRMEEF